MISQSIQTLNIHDYFEFVAEFLKLFQTEIGDQIMDLIGTIVLRIVHEISQN